jgi:RNA polymerase sigma factor (sigma-70 family)
MASEAALLAEIPSIDDLLEHAVFARRLARALVGDEARADDVVQQTWLNALEHPPRAGRGLKAWLATVVRNTASKLRRDESRREAREQRAAAPEPLPSAAEVAAQLAAQRDLLDAVARLDEPGRSTIHARFFEERTPTEIAAALGIPVRTVETRLRRAIERLRKELDERVEGGRRAWVGLLVGGSVVAMKTKSASAIAVSALIFATAATVVVTVARHEWTTSKPVAAPPAAVAQATPKSAEAPPPALVMDVKPVESAPTREPVSTAVSVFAPDGVGVPGAAIVLYRGDEVLGSATTDENGGASIPIEPSPCRLLVWPFAAPRKVVEVAAKTPSLEVTYDEGAILSGHVVVDGRPPETPIEFTLTSSAGDELGTTTETIPDAAWTKLRELRATPLWMLSARTTSDGAFAFFGLPRRVRLGLRIPAPYEDAATGETFVRFDDAREGVELALRFNPSIRGRIVDERGRPLAGWKVESFAGSEDECSSQPSVESAADGEFKVFVHEGTSRSTSFAVLFVCDPSGAFARRIDVSTSVDHGFDAGDVVVETRRVVAIDPRDEAGRPIERFVALVERKLDPREMSFRPARDVVSAERARSGVLLPEEVKSLRMVAPGFVAADVKPEPAATSVRVSLPAAASLELVVHDGETAPQPGWKLELSASKWPAAWSREEIAAAHASFGGSPMPSTSPREERASTFTLAPTKEGRLTALALLPRLPITLTLRDRFDAELLREEIVLEPGEQRRLERTLAQDAVSISGYVHDPDGKPLPMVRIDVRVGYAGDLAWTGKDGRFRIDGVRVPRISLTFEESRHSWRWLHDLDVRAQTGDLDVELEPGRSTHCSFYGLHEESKPSAVWIELASSRPTPDGSDLPPAAADRRDGVRGGIEGYAFADLPEGSLLLRARIEGFTFALPVEPECEVNYNTMLRGPVEIDWSIDPATANGRTLTALRLLPTDRDGAARATLAIDPACAARGSGLARIEKIAIGHYSVALVWSDASGQLTEEKTDVVVDVQKHESARVTLAR